ncbi:hypothetical protein [Corallococcus aberystwythensis]|uniref:ABC transporter permease n=1 Tax=Corallococcus aberystwythensis TaxID=2316722 RepID=A0A3A8QFC0_9BACT|nr:hypothetical protein [Corallococcus aberystwythensis]RKH66361.1 hypothetical protein D7W81_15670 [Corallococcus aberystwythensis]
MRDLRGHRKSLGFLYVFVHLLMLLGAGALGYAALIVAGLAAAGHSGPDAMAWDNPLFLVLAGFAVLLVVLAIAGIFMGVALVGGSPVSRRLATVLAILALPNFPLGTVLGVYSLWFFGQEGWDAELGSPT